MNSELNLRIPRCNYSHAFVIIHYPLMGMYSELEYEQFALTCHSISEGEGETMNTRTHRHISRMRVRANTKTDGRLISVDMGWPRFGCYRWKSTQRDGVS